MFSVGMIPKSWCRYTIPNGLTVIQWITDFSQRVRQLQSVSEASQSGAAALKSIQVNLKIVGKSRMKISKFLIDSRI